MRESEDALCMPPTLTPSKGFLEEKVGPGFGPARKRPLIVRAEQEDSQDGDRASHLEKRVKLSAGENLINKLPHPSLPPCAENHSLLFISALLSYSPHHLV